MSYHIYYNYEGENMETKINKKIQLGGYYQGDYDQCTRCTLAWKTGKYTECPRCTAEETKKRR
jgi:hypothetical protein